MLEHVDVIDSMLVSKGRKVTFFFFLFCCQFLSTCNYRSPMRLCRACVSVHVQTHTEQYRCLASLTHVNRGQRKDANMFFFCINGYDMNQLYNQYKINSMTCTCTTIDCSLLHVKSLALNSLSET